MSHKIIACVCLVFTLLAPVPAAAQAAAVPNAADLLTGAASELELSTFGEHVQPGLRPAKSPGGLEKFMLVAIMAAYNIVGQYGQAMRICKFREMDTASDSKEIREARACQLTMLINLQRFAEAERLAYEDGAFSPSSATPSLNEVNRLRLVAALALAQGSTEVASAFLKRAVVMVETLQVSPAQTTQGLSAELTRSLNSMQVDSLMEARRDALIRLARIAYHKQDADEYERLLRQLMESGAKPGENSWGVLAMESTDSLQQLGRTDYARDLARRSHLFVKADAGFRDAREPLENFEILGSISAVLGDERVQPAYVRSRILLARAYALLGRNEEATRVLASARSLSDKYVVEPEAGSTLIAAVEEAQGDLVVSNGNVKAAIELFRTARARLVVSSVAERSSSYGRRHNGFDSGLLRVSAKLLGVLADSTNGEVLEAGQSDEVLSIAGEFSASRADGSTQQAARTIREIRPQVHTLLEREGRLIDEMIDLRGVVAARATDPSTMAVSITVRVQERLSAIFSELANIKLQLEIQDSVGYAAESRSLLSRFKLHIGNDEAVWQWVLSPGNNVLVCITAQGVRLARQRKPAMVLSRLAKDLHQAANLRDVSTAAEIHPFPRAKAKELYKFLFGSLAPVIGRKDHWIVVAPPVLDRVPWAALVVDLQGGSVQRSDWLVDRVALTSAPSISSWVQLGERPKSTAPMAFLGVGDPANRGDVNTSQLKTRGAVVSAVASNVQVQTSFKSSFAAELQGISSIFPRSGTTLLVGKSATKAALLKLSLDRYRVILFSTHGYLRGEVLQALGPSLELTGTMSDPKDRFLAADEISQLRLDSDLVFLSACDTSASDGQLDSEGFSGLTSAFLLAGSRTVVASLWPVETSATEALVRRAFQAYQADASRPVAFAMQSAMRSFLVSPRALWRHPAFWSSFVVVGR